MPTYLDTVYATDEDVANRALADFADLAPRWNKISEGTDGVFSALDRWTLTSATTDFEVRGVDVGHVVLLRGPQTLYKGSGELFGVDVVNGGSLTLRRLGQASGKGQPPGPIEGVIQVDFSISTVYPTIEDVSYELNREFEITEVSDLYSVRDLRSLAVLRTLERLYLAEAKGGKNSEYAEKLKNVQAQIMGLSSSLAPRFGEDGNEAPPASRVNMRVVRG